jgi:hypothetical protein
MVRKPHVCTSLDIGSQDVSKAVVALGPDDRDDVRQSLKRLAAALGALAAREHWRRPEATQASSGDEITGHGSQPPGISAGRPR